jgi:hypothetical protein
MDELHQNIVGDLWLRQIVIDLSPPMLKGHSEKPWNAVTKST